MVCLLGESEERLHSARQCLEKYVFTVIGNIAFKIVECPVEDEILTRRMRTLSFITAEVCMCVPTSVYFSIKFYVFTGI